MSQNDPLHGQTLKSILEHLIEAYGWEKLSVRVRIKCFTNNPSINSSLVFLRKTPWARKKVEDLYLQSIGNIRKLEKDNFKPLSLD